MSDNPSTGIWGRFLGLPNHSPVKAVGITTLVALCAALVVSSATILLRPAQMENIIALRQQQLQNMLSTLPGLEDVLRDSGADSLDERLVSLDNGEFTDEFVSGDYNYINATSDPALSDELSQAQDIARIGRRAKIAPVYLLQKQGELQLLVLPVYGTGYQSTIRAWLTLQGDLNTIAALTINEQGETPGLGSRIEDEQWQALWKNKRLHNDAGDIAITVVKGSGEGPNEVDGISGATRTGQGINGMIEFWLGDNGFGPFLKKLSAK